MTYATNLESEGIKSQYLAVFKPRRFADSSAWSLVSGTKYSLSFDYGEAVILYVDDTLKTLATSSALSDGDWYYDSSSELIYIDIGSDPASNDVIITYEMWFGTFDAHWYRDPLDSATRQVYYEPMIQRSPQISSTATEALFGFLPTQSTQISMSNATHLFEPHVYDSSFYQADIDLYHYLGELTTDNIKLVYKGIAKSLTYSQDNVVFNLLDRTNIFAEEYRNDSGVNFYNTTLFPNLDPLFNGRPIRQVYGVVDGFLPVNIDYSAAPTTSNNRTWVCITDETNLGSVSATVPASPASTSTRTYVDSADGLRVGDCVWIDSSAGPGSDEYPIITAVNKTGNNYIDHATITNPAASSSVVKRSFVGSVTLFQNNTVFDLLYGRDYSEYTDATNKVAGFTLANNFEGNHADLSLMEPFDVLYARVYGHTNQVTLGGGSFGSDSADTGNLAQAVVIMFDLFKKLGLSEAEINTTVFTALQSSKTDQIGFAIPQTSAQDFPSYKDILNDIAQTLLAKVYIDDDLKWTMSLTGPAGSVDKTIAEDEILDGSVRYNFDYQDVISTAIVRYAFREVSKKHQITSDDYTRSTATSTTATRLHRIERQRTFSSLHFLDSEADTLASRLRYALGERQGQFSFKTKNRFFDTELGDNIKVQRAGMPGFSYDSATTREKEFITVSTDKSLTSIDITIDDQKGIEDNSGSW